MTTMNENYIELATKLNGNVETQSRYLGCLMRDSAAMLMRLGEKNAELLSALTEIRKIIEDGERFYSVGIGGVHSVIASALEGE